MIFNVIHFDSGEGDLPPGVEIVGMHLGPKTKFSHPYSYDPVLQYVGKGEPNGSLYTDRLRLWYDYELLRAKMQEHFGEQGDYWYRRKPKAIEAFLRDVMSKSKLKVIRIEEHCNVATGYPVWFITYNDGEVKA